MSSTPGSDFVLRSFQAAASRQIADRFELLRLDPNRPLMSRSWDIPYFQALSALTGAGKTPMLAQAVSDMASGMERQPVVLWVSRLRAVVEQTLLSLLPSGRYGGLLSGWSACMLGELARDSLSDARIPLLVTATVGSFTRGSPEESDLSVHRVRADEGEDSLWGVLKTRLAEGGKRPLFVVYDEAQNLSNAQTDLLMSLEPDAFLAASATMLVRENLELVIARLKREAGWTDQPITDEPGEPTKCLITQVPSREVVDAGLVKREIALGGYDSSMEAMVDDLLREMGTAEQAGNDAELPFQPRAIYVCQTNINSDDGSAESPNKLFTQRRAPPILIWRHLVARGVDPAAIAVYCDLHVNRAFPLPAEFHLFAGGDRDFGAFTAGSYRHVIFNQALQEGWDDPQVAFAYIDKTMGSQTQVEQVIGRVLRQPGTQHYGDPILNRGTFFIRLGERQQFQEILDQVRRRLGSEPGGVSIKVSTTSGRMRARQEVSKTLSVPHVVPISDDAAAAMDVILARMPDFTAGGPNVEGRGLRELAVVPVGDDNPVSVDVGETDHSSRVTARWIMSREMRTLYPRALAAIEVSDRRLDALIDRTSVAADLFRQLGRELVQCYLESTSLQVEPAHPYIVRALETDPARAVPFVNAAHASYALNSLELVVARAIDAIGNDWCRNPENGGWNIPLLQAGGTRRFFPDFLVWRGRDVFALDPKGAHLLASDAGRKVLSVVNSNRGTRVFTRLVTEGRWNNDATPAGPGGYTVWSWDMAVGRLRQRHSATADLAVASALRP